MASTETVAPETTKTETTTPADLGATSAGRSH
jgi:hypothetical protein